LSDLCSHVKTCIAIGYSGRSLIIGDQLPRWTRSCGVATRYEGDGITDVLFGAGSPAKLPVSWPKAVTDEPINIGTARRRCSRSVTASAPTDPAS